MYLFSTAKSAKALTLAFLFACFSISFISAQATFRISKPIIGTNQICSSTTNYYNNLSYAFSSNVVNSSGYSIQHNVELSNENGLITPRDVSYLYPNPNQIYTSSFDISSLNLPSGNGYRIRLYTSSPLFYSDYSETFSVLPSPPIPTLNISGSVSLCPGIPQSLTVTNPNNSYTYQWQNYSTNITNATNTTYSTSSSGSYSVKVMGANGCSVASNSVYVSQPSALNSSFQTYSNNISNYYSPLFLKSDQDFKLYAYLNGGKPPYNFTLNDGTTNTVETNINYSKDYSFVVPSSGRKIYTMTTLTDGCGSQLNNSSVLVVRVNNSKYCPGHNGGTSGIKNFSIQGTTINNINSGRALDGWGEYLTPANIYANQNYNFSITASAPNQQYFAIWADLNQNGDFEPTEKVYPVSINEVSKSFTGTFSGVLKLPSTTFKGEIRLRINLQGDYYSLSSCGTPYSSPSSNGETEDYVLNVFNGITPTTIVTDSLPKLGVCYGKDFPVNFRVLGPPAPVNTTYKVEVSNNVNFSYPITIATGTSSPIICNTNTPNNNFPFYYSQIFVRVTPVNLTPTQVVQNAPNTLKVNSLPSFTLTGTVVPYSNVPNYIPYGAYGKDIHTNSSVPISVFGRASSSNLPITVEMNDGRILTNNDAINNIVPISADVLLQNNTKYKVVRITDKVCSVTIPDSVMVSVGTPSLRIIKAKSTNSNTDTTSINKLCGDLYLSIEGKYLDGPDYGCVFLQISDANGSFDNPTYVSYGYTCFDRVNTWDYRSMSVTINSSLGLPNGTNYRIRLVRKVGNVINLVSPVFPTVFELINPTQAPVALNLSKSIINEGETTTLSATFGGGLPPYGISLFPPYYLTALYTNNTSLSINLSPMNSQRYPVFQTNGCGYFYETNISPLYVNVRTLDKNNAQWYVKPFQLTDLSPTEILKVSNLISGTDTLFKRPFDDRLARLTVNGYYDYNSDLLLKPTTILRIGANYSFHQIYNTNYYWYNNSNVPLLTGIWMDLNQDGDFEDSGEELVKTSVNTPWTNSQIQNFTIPNNADVGFTRLRVRVAVKDTYITTNTNSINSSNPIENRANTFDIPVVLFSNTVNSIISTPKITGNTLCNGNPFYIEFSKFGIADGTNAEVQLSDMNGNFPTIPIIIGQGTASTINVTLPMNLSSGNYKLRVVCDGIISPETSSFNVTTNQLTSMVDGDWHAGSTWSCGRVPTYVDATTVAGGTTVTVFSGDARVGSILTNGILSFLNGTTLRFRQP
jgi:GEVED domain